MSVQSDSVLWRLVRAARPGRPFIRITVSPWWAKILRAAGARPVASDSMTMRFGPPGRPNEVSIPGVGRVSELAGGTIMLRPSADTAVGAVRLLDMIAGQGAQVMVHLGDLTGKERAFIQRHAARRISRQGGHVNWPEDDLIVLLPDPPWHLVQSIADSTFLRNAAGETAETPQVVEALPKFYLIEDSSKVTTTSS